jgi:hypothetical protein
METPLSCLDLPHTAQRGGTGCENRFAGTSPPCHHILRLYRAAATMGLVSPAPLVRFHYNRKKPFLQGFFKKFSR